MEVVPVGLPCRVVCNAWNKIRTRTVQWGDKQNWRGRQRISTDSLAKFVLCISEEMMPDGGLVVGGWLLPGAGVGAVGCW